jgi:hypothetical protein
MSELSRRDAVMALAAGAAVTAAASTSLASRAQGLAPSRAGHAAGGTPRGVSGGVSGGSSELTQRAHTILRGTAPICGPDAITAWAHVGACVSWDDRVMMTLEDGRTGLVPVSDRARALVAGACAAGTRVAVRVWGHDARANGGVGGFAGALVALDLADLPAQTV